MIEDILAATDPNFITELVVLLGLILNILQVYVNTQATKRNATKIDQVHEKAATIEQKVDTHQEVNAQSIKLLSTQMNQLHPEAAAIIQAGGQIAAAIESAATPPDDAHTP